MPMRLTGFSPLVRKQIQDRAGGLCEVCGAVPVEALHHRRGRGMGSTRRPETNQAANGLAVCVHDHAQIESYRSEALRFGWAVPQHRIPQDVPVLRRGLWVMLFNDGDYKPIPEGARRCGMTPDDTAPTTLPLVDWPLEVEEDEDDEDESEARLGWVTW